MSQNTENKLIPGGVRETLGVALPMVMSLSFDTIMTFVDRLFLSRIGSVHMSASMAGGLASFTATTFFMGLIGYANAMVAQNLGARREERCSLVLVQAVILAIAAWPMMLLVRPLVHAFFDASNIEPQQLTLQREYFDILILGSIVPLLRHAVSSFFSGIGETRIVMFASLVGLLVNAGMNYTLIFGHFGFAPMGIRGAAIGTIIGGVATVAVLVGEYLRPTVRHRFGGALKLLRFNWEILRELIRKGTSSGLEMFFNLFAFQMMIMLFHAQGLAIATATTIMFTWDMVSFVPLLGIEVGVTSLVGRYVGANDLQSANRTTRSGILIGWVFSIVVLFAFVGIPEILVNVFRPNPVDAVFLEAFPLAVFMVRVATIYIMIEAIMVVYAGALRGAGDTFWTMIAMVSIHWTLVGALYLILNVLELGPKTAWVVLVLMFMVFPLVLWLRWRSGKWKNSILIA